MKKEDVNAKIVSDLRKAQEKRELKYVNRMVVYGYRADGYFTPNLLVMPKSSERANPLFVLENIRSAVKSGNFKAPKDLVLVRLGGFDLRDGKFTSLPHKVVCDLASELKKEIK